MLCYQIHTEDQVLEDLGAPQYFSEWKHCNTLAVAKGLEVLAQCTTPGKTLVIMSAVTNVTHGAQPAKELQSCLQLSKHSLHQPLYNANIPVQTGKNPR